MTTTESAVPASAAADDDEVFARADGLQLIGEMAGSGYRVPPALVRRSDGQTVRLTPLLYAVLEELADGRTADDVARVVTERLGRSVSADNVRTLVRTRLRPTGLAVGPAGEQPPLQRASPLLALRWKAVVTDQDLTRRLTAPFAVLFHPVVAGVVTAGFVAVAWWVLLHKGLGSATYQAFDHPALLLVIVAVVLVSAGFHEFGHAAAARRGGAVPGAMGVGLYLVWPAFYTDVTDAYRLGRVGRLRTDLGGIYFDAIVALGVFGVWEATRWDGWLLIVATQVLGMVRQLTPLVRFDGYHILCDVTGVPDLFSRIRPVLLSFLPRYWNDPDVRALKPWVRVVTTAWVLVVVPMLAFSVLSVLLGLPRLVGTSWAHVHEHAAALADAVQHGDILDAAGRAVAAVATGFPVLAIALMLGRLCHRTVRRVWAATAGRPWRRGAAGVLAIALAGGLAVSWWPSPGRYRPVQPWERGTLLDAAPVRAVTGDAAVGSQGTATLTYRTGAKLPRRDRPQLALVLVPHHDNDSNSVATTPTSVDPSGDRPATDRTWVFPFDRPLEPRPEDNQALAVNTTDDSVTYDVSFAMVWVEDGADVDQHNAAWALASCSRCVTVAVAFQVVYVVGQSDVAVPQNTAVAVNYNCLSCVTAALAQQLVLTLDHMPSEQAIAALQRLWAGLNTFAQHLPEHSLSDITQTLDDFEDQVQQVLTADGAMRPPHASSAPSLTPSLTPSVTPSAEASPTDEVPATASPSAGSASDGTGADAPAGEPSDEAGASAGQEATDSPSGAAPSPAGVTASGDPGAREDPTDGAAP